MGDAASRGSYPRRVRFAYTMGDQDISVRNVSVWYDPSSLWAAKVRAAVARLRRALHGGTVSGGGWRIGG